MVHVEVDCRHVDAVEEAGLVWASGFFIEKGQRREKTFGETTSADEMRGPIGMFGQFDALVDIFGHACGKTWIRNFSLRLDIDAAQ